MTEAVALLRGVNVGGRGKVPMARLRALAAKLDLRDARTLLQSGNLLFDVEEPRLSSVGAELERAVAEELDLTVRVLLRTAEDLTAVVAASPHTVSPGDGARHHVVFLEGKPDPAHVRALDHVRFHPDTFAPVGREVYVHYPNGSGRSKLTLDYFERVLGVQATARNWNTVTRLLGMLAA